MDLAKQAMILLDREFQQPPPHAPDGATLHATARFLQGLVLPQGSGADVAKQAMIRLDREFQRWDTASKGPAPRLLINIHDEILFEVGRIDAAAGGLHDAAAGQLLHPSRCVWNASNICAALALDQVRVSDSLVRESGSVCMTQELQHTATHSR